MTQRKIGKEQSKEDYHLERLKTALASIEGTIIATPQELPNLVHKTQKRIFVIAEFLDDEELQAKEEMDCLDLGALFYITHRTPVATAVLRAVNAHQTYPGKQKSDISEVTIDDINIVINLKTKHIKNGNSLPERLTQKEFDVFMVIAEGPATIDEIIKRAWPDTLFVNKATVATTIYRIRRKLNTIGLHLACHGKTYYLCKLESTDSSC